MRDIQAHHFPLRSEATCSLAQPDVLGEHIGLQEGDTWSGVSWPPKAFAPLAPITPPYTNFLKSLSTSSTSALYKHQSVFTPTPPLEPLVLHLFKAYLLEGLFL